MKTITINGAIRAYKYSWEKQFSFMFTESADPDSSVYAQSTIPVYIYVAPYAIEIEVEDDYEKTLQLGEIKALQEGRKLILAENQKRLEKIDNQIAQLLSIEHQEAA